MKRGQVLDAYLGWYAHHARTGDDAPEIADRIRATKSPQLQDLVGPQANDPVSHERRLRELDATDRTGLTFGHVLDVFAGAELTILNRAAEANPRYLKALDTDPTLTSVFVLLGTNHFRALETENAWRCFDAARKINAKSPSLVDVNALEARLEIDFPEAF